MVVCTVKKGVHRPIHNKGKLSVPLSPTPPARSLMSLAKTRFPFICLVEHAEIDHYTLLFIFLHKERERDLPVKVPQHHQHTVRQQLRKSQNQNLKIAEKTAGLFLEAISW